MNRHLIRPFLVPLAMMMVVAAAMAQERPGDTGKDRRGSEKDGYPYTFVQIGFVPGLAVPPGFYDTTLSAFAIGTVGGSVYGAQGSGVFNITDGSVQGFQSAGVFNISGDAEAVQAAGVFNIAGDQHGVQLAGVFNIAASVRGVQAAGIMNIADDMRGLQIAGIINIADHVSGTMIGPINIADDLDGVAIGLVNIIGNGVNDYGVDILSDSTTIVTYRSGTQFLYASFLAGQPAASFGTRVDDLTLGFGLGHRFRLPGFAADLELCWETEADATWVPALAGHIASHSLDGILSVNPGLESFFSLRFIAGPSSRSGFGPYLGVKADIDIAGISTVPERLATSFGMDGALPVDIGTIHLNVWPKVLAGIKF